MGWIQNIMDLFRSDSQRAVSPMIVASHQRDALLNASIPSLSPDQQKAAYISIMAMLINYRSSILATGMLNAQVKRRLRGETRPVEDRNPWVQLLRRPNRHTPTVMTYKWLFQNLDMVGRADFIVETKSEFARSVPIALHPIYPEFGHVEPNLGPQGQIESWTFYKADGTPRDLPVRDVLRIRRPHPVAPWLNAGIVESAAYEIDTLSAQNIFSCDLARDQGKPRVMLEAEKKMTRDRLLEVAKSFAELFRVGGSGAIPVSHDGLKIKNITITPDELRFLQEKEFTREELFTLAGVPIQLFSGEAYATGANSHRRGFMENTIQPCIDEVIAQYQFEFERLFRVRSDSTLFIESPNMIPVDEKARLENDEIRLRTGVPINRILEERGEEPVIGGDVALVPATLTPLELIGEGF